MWLPMDLLRQRSSRKVPQARSSAAENQPGAVGWPSSRCVPFLGRRTLPSRPRAMGGHGGSGLDGKGKLLQEFRAGPGGDHISSVQDALHPWRGRNGRAKEAAEIPCILTPICAEEGTDRSSSRAVELCLCSVSPAGPGHSLQHCPAAIPAVQLGPFSPSPSRPLPPEMVPSCG